MSRIKISSPDGSTHRTEIKLVTDDGVEHELPVRSFTVSASVDRPGGVTVELECFVDLVDVDLPAEGVVVRPVAS